MAAQQNANQPDNSLGFLWIIVAIFAAGMLIWWRGHAFITAIVFKIRLGEIALLSLFTHGLDSTRSYIQTTPFANVTIMDLINVSTAVGSYLRYPVAAILLFLAYWVFQNSANTQFRKTFNMKSLFAQEKKNWPYITPVEKLNLLDKDLDSGPWAMGMTPMMFAKKYKLLHLRRKQLGETGLKREMGIAATINRMKANRIFANQLGPYWKNADTLKIHAKALFAIFAAKANGDRNSAENLLRQISASAQDGRLNFSGVDKLLKKHQHSKLVQSVVERHAFEYTVMSTLLELARTDGVLATAEFLWLKPIDRRLWYTLNCTGRQTVYSEVAGIFAHLRAENEIGYKLNVPMIQQATLALEDAVSEVIYVPDEGEVVKFEDEE